MQSNSTTTNYQMMAKALRFLSADSVTKAKSGHPGMPLGMADVAVVLFSEFLRFAPKDPKWLNRDRFVLSVGHGCALLYSLLYLLGYEEPTLEDLKRFRQLGSCTAGHPEYGHMPSIETTTGPLGQGIANSVGMALGELMLRSRFGSDLVNHNTFVMLGDGCLMEGVCQEAIGIAGMWKLGHLNVIFDSNNITIDGEADMACCTDMKARFQADKWHVCECDGHDMQSIRQAIQCAIDIKDAPSLVICHTQIGKHSATEGTNKAHGTPLTPTQMDDMRKKLCWDHAPFDTPKDILQMWRAAWSRNAEEYSNWKELFASHPKKSELKRISNSVIDKELLGLKTQQIKDFFLKNNSQLCASISTRKASQKVLGHIYPAIEHLIIGGSADLTPSNYTLPPGMPIFHPINNPTGQYLHYGVREHAMGSIMNGLSMHGFIPYGGTFLVFSDYMRPPIRLASLMRTHVVFVFTHDSIAVGEDGPTHQPIEHLASLRNIPDLLVLRPCDGIETAECWQIALEHDGPCVLALTRQDLAPIRGASIALRALASSSEEATSAHSTDVEAPLIDCRSNPSKSGAYILKEHSCSNPDICIIASGSEVSLAIDVRSKLLKNDISASVVSMPSMSIFKKMPTTYQKDILHSRVLRVGIEAGTTSTWCDYVPPTDLKVGIDTFGICGQAKDVIEHFGLTAPKIAQNILDIYAKQTGQLPQKSCNN